MMMKQWSQGGTRHADFKLMISPRATLRVLNKIFSGLYISKTMS